MRKRWKLLLAAACALLGCILLATPKREPDLYYQGRKLSDWIRLYKASPEDERAANAIREIGTNAFPFLLTWMDEEPPSWHRKGEAIAQKFPLWIQTSRPVRWLLSTDRAERRAQNAMYAFQALGPIATSAIPELARRVRPNNTEAVRHRALFALSSIGPTAVPIIQPVFAEPRSAMDLWITVLCLQQMGTNARPLVPLIVRNLQHTNSFAAGIAISMLGELQLETDIVIPALSNSLADPRADVRMWVPQALGRFGAAARPTLGALSNVLNDSDPNVRQSARTAIDQTTSALSTNEPPQ